MTRHNFDGRIFDYTWKQNRLSKDKEALKSSMLNVLRKKPKMAVDQVSWRLFNMNVFSLEQRDCRCSRLQRNCYQEGRDGSSRKRG